MKILSWEFSERYSKYLNQLTYISPKNILYHFVNEHPDPYYRGMLGVANFTEGLVNVYLNPNLGNELAEETACHEIEHWELVGSGFSFCIYPEYHGQSQSPWSYVCDTMNSSFADIKIDSKQRSFGYNQVDYRLRLFLDTLNVLKTDGHVVYPTECGNAIGVCRTALTLNREQWKELKKAYLKYSPRDYNLGLKVLDIYHKIGIQTPEDYKELLKAIVNLFRISKKEIYLYNLLKNEKLSW